MPADPPLAFGGKDPTFRKAHNFDKIFTPKSRKLFEKIIKKICFYIIKIERSWKDQSRVEVSQPFNAKLCKISGECV